MGHNLLHDPKIFQLLYRVDEALAEEARTTRCALWWEVAPGGLPPQTKRLFTGVQNTVRLALQFLL